MTATVDRPLVPGDAAPNFTLVDQNGSPQSLDALLRDRPVAVVFFPFAFSGICTGELSEIRDDLGRFDNDAVQVVAVSCDPMHSLRAWADREGYFFPLLSDFWPHGSVGRSFGVFHKKGFSRRGTFLVNSHGLIEWTLINEAGERRDFSGLWSAVTRLAPAPVPD